MKILIHKIEDAFAVKQGEVEVGRWKDVRKAKAARGALETALRLGQHPAFAVLFALEAAADDAIVASYNDAQDETFAE